MSLPQIDFRRFGAVPLWLAAAAIVLTVIFGDLPGEGLYVAVLQNGCHAPAFAALSLLALSLLPRSIRSPLVRAVLIVGIMLLVGAATEGIQSLFGRDAELEDVINDVAGALATVSVWLYLRGAGARLGRMIAVVIFAGAAGYWLNPFVQCARAYWERNTEFPILAQFHSSVDLAFITSSGSDTQIVAHAHALQASLDSGPWPGITLAEPVADWRGYRALAIDVGNPGATALPLVLRVNDRAHRGIADDRFNTELTLPPRSRRTIRIALEEIEHSPRNRLMDMSQITQLILFRSGGAPDQVVQLYRIWLE
jgi:hypothetical protein